MNKKESGWSSHHKPNDVRLGDTFMLYSGVEVIVGAIVIHRGKRKTTRYEFREKDTEVPFEFEDIKWKLVD